MTWAQHLKRVFDIETCREYGGTVTGIACIEYPMVIEKILIHLGKNGTALGMDLLPEGRAPPVSLFV